MIGKNLGEILQDLHDKLDFNPDLKPYKNSLIRRVNDHYREVCTENPWLFLQKTITLQLRATVDGSTGVTAEVPSANRRRVDGTGTSWRADMAGMTITFGTGTSAVDYVIQSVDADNQYLYLTRTAPGAIAATTDWHIRYPQYTLPADFVDLLGLVSRTDGLGELRFIDRAQENAADLEGIAAGTGTSYMAYLVDTIHDTPPSSAPTVATQSGGSLEAATEYAYAYAWVREGREGPMSPIATIETTMSDKTVRITPASSEWRLPSGGGSPTLESGIHRALYRRDDTNDGAWLRITTLTVNSPIYYDDADVLPEYAPNLLEVDAPGWSGPREQIRFWYTAGEDRELELRYHYQPPPLIADTDRPHLPRQRESMLVDLVMQELTQKVGDDRGYKHYSARVKEHREKMIGKHLRRSKQRTARMGWKTSTNLGNHGRGMVYGIPSKTG